MNGQYIRNLSLADLTERLRAYQEERGLPGAADPRLEAAAAAVQEKISTLSEFTELVGFAFEPIEMDERSWRKVMEKDGAGDALHVSAMLLRVSTHSTRVVSKARCGQVVEQLDAKPGPSFSRFVLPSPARRCRRVSSRASHSSKGRVACADRQCANAPRYSVDLVATIQSTIDRLCMNAVCALHEM